MKFLSRYHVCNGLLGIGQVYQHLSDGKGIIHRRRNGNMYDIVQQIDKCTVSLESQTSLSNLETSSFTGVEFAIESLNQSSL